MNTIQREEQTLIKEIKELEATLQDQEQEFKKISQDHEDYEYEELKINENKETLTRKQDNLKEIQDASITRDNFPVLKALVEQEIKEFYNNLSTKLKKHNLTQDDIYLLAKYNDPLLFLIRHITWTSPMGHPTYPELHSKFYQDFPPKG